MRWHLPLDGVLPSGGHNIFIVSTLPILNSLNVDCGFPSANKLALLLLVVWVKEDELFGIEQYWILEGVPSVILKCFVVISDDFIVVRFLLLLLSL